VKFIGIIPARFASTRFPGKPLIDIGGKSMIQRVYEQTSKVLSEVFVATDDFKIRTTVEEFGGKVIMTDPRHNSGTDRVAEAADIICSNGIECDVVINIQGDEPFIHESQIETLIDCFKDSNTQIATLIKKIKNKEELFNPNIPKVVKNINQEALYFSRSPIPYVRGAEKDDWVEEFDFYKHIGIYAYKKDILKEITKLPQSKLEIIESLEQLRWIENGYSIKTGITEIETVSIDTPEDLRRVKEMLL
jgi:3-deoxy-manno-octulosonate cytidylyltransferase (CMP-KDO synthetase)